MIEWAFQGHLGLMAEFFPVFPNILVTFIYFELQIDLIFEKG